MESLRSIGDSSSTWIFIRSSMGEEGLEPSHLAVPDPKSGASTRFRHPPALARCSTVHESGGNRTHNLWIKSPLLCQLSYAPAIAGFAARACIGPPPRCQRKPKPLVLPLRSG